MDTTAGSSFGNTLLALIVGLAIGALAGYYYEHTKWVAYENMMSAQNGGTSASAQTTNPYGSVKVNPFQ